MAPVLWAIAGGLLNGLGVLATLAAYRRGGKASVVTPLAAIYPMVTVILAVVFLGERLLTLSYAAIGYFQYLFFYWMHYYFEQVLRLGKIESRIFAALPVLAMALTMPLGGWLSTRLETKYGWRAARVYVAGLAMLGAVLCLIAGVLAQAQPWTVIAFTLALASLGLSEAAFWQTAIELGGARGGTAAALMNTGGNGIGLLAPLLTPFIAAHLGWQAGLGMGAVVCLLGALCWLWIRPAPATNDARNL